MRKTREQIEYQLSIKRNRLELYLKREAEMAGREASRATVSARAIWPATTPTSDPSGPPSNSSRQTSKPSRPH